MNRSPALPAPAQAAPIKSGLALYLLAVVAAALAVSPAKSLDDEDGKQAHSASL